MPPIRLQKYLAENEVGSRRACEQLIRDGLVSVNGETAFLGQQVDPDLDAILVKGLPVASGDPEKVYVVLNKPTDVITTAKDTHGRRTVMDYLNGLEARVFPVGRLDQDVEGVLLFTNDGELAFRLTHPKFQVNKVYLAWVRGSVGDEAVRRLQRGVQLDDGMSAPAQAKILNAGKDTSLIKLTIHEGRKREVKRMCAAVGHPVENLHRIAFANVLATGLRPGEWRRLSDREIEGLRRCVGMDSEG